MWSVAGWATQGELGNTVGKAARHAEAGQLWGRGTCRAAIGSWAKRTVKLKLDLHDIYNAKGDIDRALRAVIEEAIAKKASVVEIIPGKGSGQLKKHVLRFLDRPDIKQLYHRVEKDSKNFGRLFVHFRWR